MLIRNAEALERLEKVDTLVVDKTGTLTVGRPRRHGHRTVAGQAEETISAGWRRASSRQASIHSPLRWSRLPRKRGLELAKGEDFKALIGRGVSGTVAGHAVALGSAGFLAELGVDARPLIEDGGACATKARRSFSPRSTGGLPASSRVADPVRPTTPAALAALAADGVAIVMLSGDNSATAQAVARQLGIDRVGGRGAAGRQGGRDRAAQAGGQGGGDGRRRRQRRAGAGGCRCRDRNGLGHRCGDRQRRASPCCGAVSTVSSGRAACHRRP